MSRLPIRLRMTLAFVAITGLVLTAMSLYLHQRLANDLDSTLHAGLRSRAGDLAAAVTRSGPAQIAANPLIERGDDPVQVLDAQGRVTNGATGYTRTPLLTAAQVTRATAGPLTIERTRSRDDALALVAAPAGDHVVVVGSALEQRDEALSSLDGLLAFSVPAALLLAGLAGFVVASGSMRPIERIRSHAQDISAGDLHERLPEPVANDEVRRLATTLNAMLARLQDSFDRERTFVADASHELRTPLARLKAEMELASGGGLGVAELRDAIASGAAEADTLARLADDLLVLARADQGRLPVRREPIALAEFLAGLGAGDVACPPELTVSADPLRLRQALGNLVDNAHRHGSSAPRIVAENGGGSVRIHVLDAGPGVPAPFRPAAFDRFSRGDAAREGSGAGLGLAIVAAVAAAHDGNAGIDDAPGGGADIWIELPAV